MRIELYVSSELPQDVTEDIIIREAGKYFSAFSLNPITVIWKGMRKQNHLLVLENADSVAQHKAEQLAEDLGILHQDAMLMVVTDTTTKLI